MTVSAGSTCKIVVPMGLDLGRMPLYASKPKAVPPVRRCIAKLAVLSMVEVDKSAR